MKILLINPPSRNEIMGNNPSVVEEERGYNPPLGLLYLATYIKTRKKHDVKIIDAQVEELSYPELGKKIADFRPDVTGVSAMTLTFIDVIKTSEAVRKAQPGCRLVIGGPHVHLYPEQTLRSTGADFGIMGEGEISFTELLNSLEDGKDPDSIPGIIFFRGKTAVYGPDPEPIEMLDSIPAPDRSLLPYEKYSSILSARKPVTTMFTSRGCPYRCSFCDRPHLGKKFRAHSAQYVVDEMQTCQDLGIKEILMYDDTFTIDRERTIQVCREYCKRKLSVVWDIRARVNTVDEEVLYWLSRANCQRIHFGVEAGTEKILKVLRKGITLEQAKKAFKLSRKFGIETLAYFMIGSPTETEQDIRQTFKVAADLAPDYLHMTVLTPFPGTEIYKLGMEQGLFPDFWKGFSDNPDPSFTPCYWEKEISSVRLKELIKEGYKQFYFRPSYILKRVSRLKSGYEFVKKAKAAFRLYLWGK